MTDASRRLGTAWLLAPLAVGSFVLASDWALHHDPATAAPPAVHGTPSATTRLQQQVSLAARRLQWSEAALVRLESSVRQRSTQARHLETDVRAAAQARRQGRRVPALSDGPTAPAPVAPMPAPVAVPAGPSVHTTSGAS